MQFLNMKRVALTVIALLIAGTSAAHANGIPEYIYLTGTDGVTRAIEIDFQDDDGMIRDVNIYESYSDAILNPGCEDQQLSCLMLNSDAFDGFGNAWINEQNLSEGDIESGGSWNNSTNTYSYTSSGATVQISMAENYIEFTVTKAATNDLWIYGDLGSDEDTTWVSGDSLYSWDGDSTGDPILRWEHNGSDFAYGDGVEYVGPVGSNSVTLRIYIYAHSNPEELDDATYMANFQEWVNENVARTDIFTGVAQRAPALTYGNPNSYADPTGELRALINQIKGLSGSLIGWK